MEHVAIREIEIQSGKRVRVRVRIRYAQKRREEGCKVGRSCVGSHIDCQVACSCQCVPMIRGDTDLGFVCE